MSLHQSPVTSRAATAAARSTPARRARSQRSQTLPGAGQGSSTSRTAPALGSSGPATPCVFVTVCHASVPDRHAQNLAESSGDAERATGMSAEAPRELFRSYGTVVKALLLAAVACTAADAAAAVAAAAKVKAAQLGISLRLPPVRRPSPPVVTRIAALLRYRQCVVYLGRSCMSRDCSPSVRQECPATTA